MQQGRLAEATVAWTTMIHCIMCATGEYVSSCIRNARGYGDHDDDLAMQSQHMILGLEPS